MTKFVTYTPDGEDLKDCGACGALRHVLGFEDGLWLCEGCAGLALALVIGEMNRLAGYPDEAIVRCRVCGCWDFDPCWDEDEGPCWWVEADLCSRCAQSKSESESKVAVS